MVNWIREKVLKISNLKLANLELIITGWYIMIFLLFTVYAKINSDEYLYASITNSIVDAMDGRGRFGDIDTWHTFLLPGILAVFKLVSGSDSFFISRIIVTLFSIGSVLLLYKLFQELFSESKVIRLKIAVLLLMFPGFFYFGSMIFLDNAAFFFFILLIYYIVKREGYWKVGVVLTVLFLIKEYYIVLGGFVVLVAIIHELFTRQKRDGVLEQFKIFAQNIITAYWLPVAMLGVILLFPVIPYASLLGTFMVEIFGNKYAILGKMFNEFIFSSHSGIIVNDTPNLIKEVGTIIRTNGSEINNLVAFLDRAFATRETFTGFIEYFNRVFKEIYLNTYTVPLSLYGVYVYFRDNKKRWSRAGIVMLSVLIAFTLFFSRTAHLGLSDFRFAFITIIPFLFFSIFAIKDLLSVNKFRIRHYIFIICTALYIWMMLEHIRDVTSSSILYGTAWVQVLVKYKHILNSILYMFPIVMLFLDLTTTTKKRILVVWLVVMFSQKTMPLLLNGYMIEKRSSIEYNLVESKSILNRIERGNPNILTNYKRAYYYYSDSGSLPNNTRKNLPIIRPKPSVIHKNRVSRIQNNDFLVLTVDYLCKNSINYIFYVNREFNDKSDIVSLVMSIQGISMERDFYEGGILSWGLYRFDNKVCK